MQLFNEFGRGFPAGRGSSAGRGFPSSRGALVLILLTSMLVTAGCGFFRPPEDPTKDWSERRLYDAARGAMSAGDYEQAINFYQSLGARYPYGPIAEQGQIELAYAYFKFDEPESALATADRFIKEHPRHQNLDYVHYLKGLTNYQRGSGFFDRVFYKDPSRRDTGPAREAFRDFDLLVTRFPDSRYAEDASERMQFLKSNIAMQEVHVAQFYLRRRAYVAASGRARFVLENYQGTEAVPHALVVLAKSYRTLALDDLYEDTLRVLKLNYGDSAEFAEDIREVERLQLQ